ncbi:MAG TPA: SDR family oxidoreductase [Polyangiaceae bacterium]|nr:SDR family oxidoreductase [Polyangiaceae bacterium]
MTSDAPGAAPAAAESRGPLREHFAGEVVLITGFPGFRAQALVRTLAEREHSASLWFVVPPSEIEAAARVLATCSLRRDQLRLIPGEPCAIDLGLSRQVYAELSQRVDRWFSLYQTTDIQAKRELCFRVNLGSAREIAELSKVAENLSQVTFLSSSCVFGDHQGDVAEEALSVGQSFRSAASESLALAEAFLRRRLADASVSVVRTPPVLGALAPGVTGTAPRPSGLHRLLAHVARAPSDAALPLPPGSHRPVQVLPADFVADALYTVAVLGTRGRAYHFAEPEPPSLAEVLEQAARHFGKRFEQGFDPRSLGRLLLKSPGFWLSQQSSRALSEWAEGPQLLTRGGDRLLERAGLRAPPLLSYLDAVLRETDELMAGKLLDERRYSQPFEVVA